MHVGRVLNTIDLVRSASEVDDRVSKVVEADPLSVGPKGKLFRSIVQR